MWPRARKWKRTTCRLFAFSAAMVVGCVPVDILHQIPLSSLPHRRPIHTEGVDGFPRACSIYSVVRVLLHHLVLPMWLGLEPAEDRSSPLACRGREAGRRPCRDVSRRGGVELGGRVAACRGVEDHGDGCPCCWAILGRI
jgi:hypothetical protein